MSAYELYESYLNNVKLAEECGISAEELWNTLYKPHVIAMMKEN